MTAALILASGLSERMGTPKALLKWSPTVTFLEKLVTVCLEAGCSPVVCTIGEAILPCVHSISAVSGVMAVVNRHPEKGRLFAVKLGLSHIRHSPNCLVLNVDNPCIDAAIAGKIIAAADPRAWCSPEYRGQGGHPVLIPDRIVKRILDTTETGQTLRGLLGGFPKKAVEMDDDRILRNINTPEDYAALWNN